MKTSFDRLAKIYTNRPVHMTKMANLPIYSKTPFNIFFLEPKGQWPWELVCSSGDVGPTQVCSNDKSRLTLT